MRKRLQKFKTYGEGVFGVTPSDFRKFKTTLKTTGNIVTEGGSITTVSCLHFVPMSFTLDRFVHPARSPEHRNVRLHVRGKPVDNVQFLKRVYSVKAFKQIKKGDILFR